MVTSSRRAGRVTNKTKLVIYKGSNKVDLTAAETIVWENESTGGAHAEATKHQHVGAKGVESGELLEHHLQAALSSASLLHSRTQSAKPSSPKPSSSSSSTKPEPTTASSALNYHIPTPDATGIVDNNHFTPLYQATKYVEPVNYIRFSDTVEESSGGWGGLGYCMDDKDVKWLNEFNAKAEGSSGGEANGTVAASSPQTPLKESQQGGNQPPSAGRGMRAKGKEKEKEKNESAPAPLFISEDTFEYIMGVFEKYAEDSVPMLHTNISLLPPFASVEPMFSSPIPASFLPSNEIPKGLPDLKVLSRMARSIYSHWKARREERNGKSIMPALNYDETNDNDPYVCFRRRDIRATRKTRRTDNHSIEQFQKLQTELRNAHNLAQMVVRRENEKKALFKADRDVWEAKWKLFEIKRRWPSLGMSREEEEIITGRPMSGVVPITIPSLANGHALHPSQTNIPQMRKKVVEKDRDEREKRERAMEAARAAEKNMGSMAGRSNAPEALKERMLALQQKLEELLVKKKEADAHWDDCTDSSYQPLPQPHSIHTFRPITALDPHYSVRRGRANSDDDEDEPVLPSSFRLRRGRGGVVRLDRRTALLSRRRGSPPSSPTKYPDWLFPDTAPSRSEGRRPRSIDELEEDSPSSPEVLKRRRLNEVWRYDVDRGGALGVGMGVLEDQDRVIVDDLESKYVRNRISLLREEDIDKLRPDVSVLAQAAIALETPIELPPTPVFVRPQVVPPNPQLVAAHLQQQQLLQQQQQMEQFQRFQLLAQQQALVAQQQQAAMAQAQAQAQGMPNQSQVQQRVTSADGSANGAAGSPVVNGQQLQQQMPPPNSLPNQAQNGRPPVSKRPSQTGQTMGPPVQARPSLSPTNSLHPAQQAALAKNGQSPQLVNGMMLPNGKTFIQNGGANGAGTPQQQVQQLDPQVQQRIMAARLAAQAQQQLPQQPTNLDSLNPEQLAELTRVAQQAGFGDNIQGFIDARNKATLLRMAKLAQQQQAQQVAQQQQAAAQAQAQQQQQQQQQAGNGGAPGPGQPGFSSPALPTGSLQLKLPPHAAARLGAASTPNGQQQQSSPAPQRA
nr:uncharacterized protein CI109_000376 [Kwoniella shandongensis]KAA5531534.1 hypothetical protein CI109_000376 [Kwoniella shandongensis]